MKTYLLAWSTKRSQWDNLPETAEDIKVGKNEPIRWSCGRSKKLKRGDRVFLIKLGEKPKGIFASGSIVRDSYEDTHWDSSKAQMGETSFFVKVHLDTLLVPGIDQILPRELLNDPPFSDMHWDTQMSGIQIPDYVASELEILWTSFKNSLSFSLPEEVEQEEIFEGAVRRVTVNAYERNPEARRQCINHYGTQCSVCGFDFAENYGEIGKDFIHVHHLKQLSEIADSYQVNPIKDLRPVCPNCHAMIHKRKHPYTIEELKTFLGNK